MKQQVRRFEKPIVIVALSILGAVLVAVMVVAIILVYRRSRPQLTALVPRAVASISQTTQAGPLDVKVDAVREDDKGDPGFMPGTSYHYVIVDMALLNRGRTSVSMSPVAQAYLRDVEGTVYQMAPAPTDHPLAAAEMVPGASAWGEISFDVPDSAHGLVLYYQVGAYQPAAVNLGR